MRFQFISSIHANSLWVRKGGVLAGHIKQATVFSHLVIFPLESLLFILFEYTQCLDINYLRFPVLFMRIMLIRN